MSRPLVCDYVSALEFLLERINYERTTAVPYRTGAFKLDRMRRLMSLLGDPHLGLKAVHIAGTKGKGSTAAMIAAVLEAAGLPTGLYTSPHLDAIEERIAIGGVPCPRADFVHLAADLDEAVGRLKHDEPLLDQTDPTFFEVTTAMAFLHFARQNVAAAVLEVGLGGRLDSTNVCQPSVTVITSISFDHTRQLGNTLAAIAGEKAGIIKPGVPVISGVVKEEPREVIRQAAREQRAPLFERATAFDFDVPDVEPQSSHVGQTLHYREPAADPRYRLSEVRLSMLGRHQAANAAVAIAAIRRLIEQGWSIDERALRRGLTAARTPARIEVLAERPTVIVDVAHNVASIEALLEVLRQRFAARRRVLVFASSKDKDTAGMLRLLLPQFDSVVLTQYVENPRAVEPEQLHQLAQTVVRSGNEPAATNGQPAVLIYTAATPAEAWEIARESAEADDLICVTGSFFLAAELRPQVLASANRKSP
jgi:dihydrofolate synthase/folylpolyglutamate synthase